MDPVLEPFWTAPAPDQEDERLGALLSLHAEPVVRKVVSRRLGGARTDADDIVSQVLLQLMLRLRQGKLEDTLGGIDGFANYAAAAAHHACDHAVRRKHPARWRLRNRLRYVLTHDRELATWQGADGAWLCGRMEWTHRRADGALPREDQVSGTMRASARHLLIGLFHLSNGPLELASVVDLAASVWQIPQVEMDDSSSIELVRDSKPGVDVEIEQRRKATQTWAQIGELPVRQRQALLLNLKGDAIGLFLVTGTASLRAIARALEMSVEALAAMWNDLPLSDSELASRLDCTRQQVINLRMAARKRLANRLAGWS
jgi:RNA polymerase sigma factor (sigma-70 family)